MKNLFIISIAFASTTLFAAKTSNLLISAFCPNTGSQTAQALNQSQQLNDLLDILENDPNCAAVAASSSSLLDNITSLDAIVSNQTIGEREAKKLKLYEEQAAIERSRLIADYASSYRLTYEFENPEATPEVVDQAVEVALSNFTPSSNLLNSLSDTVNELELNVLSHQLQTGFDQEDNTLINSKVGSIKANMKSVFSALNTSNACTNANESIAPSIVSNVLGLASTVVPGVAGMAVGLGADLMSGSASLIRSIKYNGQRRGIEINEMKAALSCSFEGISNTYCKAQDTMNLINFDSTEPTGQCTGKYCKTIKLGVDLLAKKIPSLNSWVNLILSGASPSDESQVGPASSAINRRAKFNVMRLTLDGKLNGARRQFSAPGANQTLVIRNLMTDLAETAAANANYGSDNNKPLFEDFFLKENDKTCGAWAYFFNPEAGIDDRALEGRPDTSTCEHYATNTYQGIISFAELQERIRRLNEETLATIAFEIQLVAEENSSRILLGYTSLDNTFRSSPKKFMDSALNYYTDFEAYLSKIGNNNTELKNSIIRAEKQIKNAQKIMGFSNCSDFETEQPNSSTTPSAGDPIQLFLNEENCDVEAAKLANLSNILAPQQQTLSVEGSLRSIFREHIELAKDNGDISDEDLVLILNGSNEDSSGIFVRNALKKQDLFEDADTAMSVSKGNLENFWSIYSKAIIATAKKLKTDNDKYVLGRLCVRAALAPVTSRQKRKLRKYCSGTVYKSTNRKVKDIKFNDVISKKFEDKACLVYNFKREIEYRNNL